LSTPPTPDVTGLLLSWRRSQPDAAERLLPLVYAKLHRLAHARMRAESPGCRRLQTAGLVHEAFARLVDGERVEWQNRAHSCALCARLMRRFA
jgi:RNA polymerase sigma-70 factor (ECF subfamily)